MLHILLRTSDRPKGFNRTMNALRNQTDMNFKLLVTVDNAATKTYVEASQFPCEIYEVKSEPRLHSNHNPYNLYVNTLIDNVKDGWYIVIDDDDIVHNDLVESINTTCTQDDAVYIFKINFMGKPIPSHSFGKSIAFGDISSPCIIMNSKNKNLARWKPVRGGDFNYIKDVVESGKLKIGFVDKVIYTVEKPGSGKKEDI